MSWWSLAELPWRSVWEKPSDSVKEKAFRSAAHSLMVMALPMLWAKE